MNPLDVRLGDYLESLTDNNWHVLRYLIELERNLLTEDDARDALSVYLTARNKRQAIRERQAEENYKRRA